MEDVLRCPRCKSTQTRSRVKTGDRICYSCGNIYKVEEEEQQWA